MHEFDDCFDTNFLCVLASVVGEDGVLMAEPMRDHTTFNIGGPADVMILPRTRDEVVRVLDICLTAACPARSWATGRIFWWETAGCAGRAFFCVITIVT